MIAIVKPHVVKQAYTPPKRDKSASRKNKISDEEIKSEKYFQSDILKGLEGKELEEIIKKSSRGHYVDVET